MKNKNIIFVSGNKEKVSIVKKVLSKYQINVINNKKMNCIEIQSDNNCEIAEFLAKY